MSSGNGLWAGLGILLTTVLGWYANRASAKKKAVAEEEDRRTKRLEEREDRINSMFEEQLSKIREDHGKLEGAYYKLLAQVEELNVQHERDQQQIRGQVEEIKQLQVERLSDAERIRVLEQRVKDLGGSL